MTEQAVYKVIGRRAYRGHEPGTVFPSSIDPVVAQRAIDRGDIELVERIEPDLLPGSYALPRGWAALGAARTTNEAPRGASLIQREEG